MQGKKVGEKDTFAMWTWLVPWDRQKHNGLNHILGSLIQLYEKLFFYERNHFVCGFLKP
jgi:hypothetical protein